MLKVLASICFIGSFISFGLGAISLFRFPDSYTRIHGLGIGETMGVALAGLGLLLLSPDWIIRLKLIFILFLFWMINPTMTHLIMKAGLLHGVEPVDDTRLRLREER
ncbi:MAG: monovalent cation/H(+) antiporter subunit G [Halanaerobiales bacterium]|jgi:multicomponent Na+:H+ antiporter subunit G